MVAVTTPNPLSEMVPHSVGKKDRGFPHRARVRGRWFRAYLVFACIRLPKCRCLALMAGCKVSMAVGCCCMSSTRSARPVSGENGPRSRHISSVFAKLPMACHAWRGVTGAGLCFCTALTGAGQHRRLLVIIIYLGGLYEKHARHRNGSRYFGASSAYSVHLEERWMPLIGRSPLSPMPPDALQPGDDHCSVGDRVRSCASRPAF